MFHLCMGQIEEANQRLKTQNQHKGTTNKERAYYFEDLATFYHRSLQLSSRKSPTLLYSAECARMYCSNPTQCKSSISSATEADEPLASDMDSSRMLQLCSCRKPASTSSLHPTCITPSNTYFSINYFQCQLKEMLPFMPKSPREVPLASKQNNTMQHEYYVHENIQRSACSFRGVIE